MAAQRRSRPVGRVMLRVSGVTLGTKTVQVYEALQPITCSWCQRRIATGHLFTHRRRRGEATGHAPVCRACAPFPEPL